MVKRSGISENARMAGRSTSGDYREQKSNYDIFRRESLIRFQSFEQEKMIRRLNLLADEEYIYIEMLQYRYRFSRTEPLLEKKDLSQTSETLWDSADTNETLTLCDLLCHTEEEIHVQEGFTTLQSLNRVQGGNTQATLGKGMFHKTEEFFDGKAQEMQRACEELGGIQAGKGDVSYEIPIFGELHVRVSFYESDDEFEAALTVLYPTDICRFLHYETLYYLTMIVIERIKDKMCNL